LALQGIIATLPLTYARVQSFTFPSTVLATLNSGRSLELVDIDSKTWTMEASRDDQIIDVVTLPFGSHFVSTPFIHKKYLVIDAAASIGNAKSWLSNMLPGWAAMFSLHATKSFGLGEGALAVFGSESQAKAFRSWINFGFSGQRESIIQGTNAKLSEYSAAVGLSVLDSWTLQANAWEKLRIHTTKISRELGIAPFALRGDEFSPYWIVRFDSENQRNKVRTHLQKHNVETRLWWGEGCHRMGAFVECPRTDLSITDEVSKRYLGLPYHLGMLPSDFQFVANLISETLDTNRK
jgi:dTDP-4-amino-4,6-dideoxygalactose transaminase